MEIVIEGLRFERDGRLVLEVPKLSLGDGRTTAILGPNGAGKTTLLRLIAALERPSAGTIRLGAAAVRPDRATRQTIAFLFQQPVFLAQSVRHNLDLALELRGVEAQERTQRIGQATALLQVGHLLDRRADRLSGGEARRVSLASALCLQAPVVLLDEPLSGLDPATRARLADELPAVLRAFGATTLFVTHDRDEALRLGDDIVVLVQGRVLATGSKAAVVTSPADRVVAELLGYTVIEVDGECLAVPPAGLRLGPGPNEFWITVEEVVDLVERRELIGRYGEQRLRVPVAAETPRRGERLLVHPARSLSLARTTDG